MNGTEIAGPGTAPASTPLVHRLPVAGQMLGGISRGTVRTLIRKGELEAVPVGHTLMVTHASIVAYLDRQRERYAAGEITIYGTRKNVAVAA